MSDYYSRREQREKWREERRKWRDEKWKGRHMQAGIIAHGNIWTGLIILAIGVALLLKAMLVPVPDWLFSWPMILIVIGLLIGFKRNFHGSSWLILLLIGGAFLAEHVNPDIHLQRYTWPVVLIILGAFFILRPRRRHWWDEEEKKSGDYLANDPHINPDAASTTEDYLDITSVFGATNKKILSKNFRGGDIVNVFGGSELNFSQADINGQAIIETTTIFGGAKLIVPANWEVRSDAAVIFGGIEDKRAIPATTEPAGKLLLLKGTVIFGGIEIKSFG